MSPLKKVMLNRVKNHPRSLECKQVLRMSIFLGRGHFEPKSRPIIDLFMLFPKFKSDLVQAKIWPKKHKRHFWTQEVMSMPSINGVTGHAQKRKMKNFGA